MGNRYIIKQQNITPGSGTDILTMISIASRRGRIVEVAVAGRGNTSAAQQIEVGRSTGGSTSSSPQTPDKFDHVDEPAAAFNYPIVWGTQPTLTANSEVIGWNALGGGNRWIPPRGTGLEIRNGDQVSFRASVGVTFQPMSFSCIVEED